MKPLQLVIFMAAVFLASMAQAKPRPLSETEIRMIRWIDAQSGAVETLLEQQVNINSGSMNHDGVREVGRVLGRELDALGFKLEWINMPADMDRAGHLFARHPGRSGKKLLLIGHLDTVFEKDDSFQKFERHGDWAHGPGVEDMKSGNIVILYALKALAHIGALDSAQIEVAYTGDEEKPGRPLSVSRQRLIEGGRWADVALGFESGIHYDDKDWATVARRSSSGWRLEISGKQAHSSGIFSAPTGAGAVFEAARILSAFYTEVRGEEYLTFNAGAIVGGTDVEYDFARNRGSAFGKTNIVPQRVVVQGGLRTISLEQLTRAQDAMRAVVARHLPRTSATIRFVEGYPPMAPTEGNLRLQRLLSDINVSLGRGPMPALDPARRGAADISFVAPYTDGLAGLGAIGEGGHSPRERLDLSSLPVAIQRAAILIYRLSLEP